MPAPEKKPLSLDSCSTASCDHTPKCPYFIANSLGAHQSFMSLDGDHTITEACMTIPPNDSGPMHQSPNAMHNRNAQGRYQAGLSPSQHPTMLQDGVRREPGVEDLYRGSGDDVRHKSQQYYPIPRSWATANLEMISNKNHFSMAKWWRETVKDQPWNAFGAVAMGKGRAIRGPLSGARRGGHWRL